MKREISRKCHNCKGTGKVEGGNRASKCLYCRGKGYKNNVYGADEPCL